MSIQISFGESGNLESVSHHVRHGSHVITANGFEGLPDSGGPWVSLFIDRATTFLTPKQARDAARTLLEAADVADPGSALGWLIDEPVEVAHA